MRFLGLKIAGLSLLMTWGGCPSRLLAEAFDISRLSYEQDVTLPSPATTHIPINYGAQLKANDKGQMLKLSVSRRNARQQTPAQPVTVAIRDKHQDRVQYIELKPKAKVLYTFYGLSSIQVTAHFPSVSKVKGRTGAGFKSLVKSTVIQVESNKPLTVTPIPLAGR